MINRDKELLDCLVEQLKTVLDLGLKNNYSCLTDSDGLIDRLQDNITKCIGLIRTDKTEKDILQEQLLNRFPDFAKHEKILQENGIIKITANGYDWLKSKKSLADYFGFNSTDKIHWALIQKLFTWKGKKVKNGKVKKSTVPKHTKLCCLFKSSHFSVD